MSTHRQSRVIILIVSVIAVAVIILTVQWLRTPIRNAQKIQIGDGVSVVTELLGEPTAEFRNDVELQSSNLKPMSFVFKDIKGSSAVRLPVETLPNIRQRALWFEYSPTAGHLVYLDESDLVEMVFWGGT